jgi:hypothetical protein
MNRRDFTKHAVLGALAVTVPHGISGCVGSDAVDNLQIGSPNDWAGVLTNVVETIKQSHILPWRNLPEAAFDAKSTRYARDWQRLMMVLRLRN